MAIYAFRVKDAEPTKISQLRVGLSRLGLHLDKDTNLVFEGPGPETATEADLIAYLDEQLGREGYKLLNVQRALDMVGVKDLRPELLKRYVEERAREDGSQRGSYAYNDVLRKLIEQYPELGPEPFDLEPLFADTSLGDELESLCGYTPIYTPPKRGDLSEELGLSGLEGTSPEPTNTCAREAGDDGLFNDSDILGGSPDSPEREEVLSPGDWSAMKKVLGGEPEPQPRDEDPPLNLEGLLDEEK